MMNREKLLLVLAAILLASWFSRPISDPDFWWHLKTGQYLWETHRLPAPDPFAYTTAGAGEAYPGEALTRHFNLTHEWLAQALMYLVWRGAGLRRSRAGPGAAAGGILRACRAGGLAQVRRVLSRAGSRAGGWNRGRRLRGGPAVPGDVPPARDVRGAARVPAPVMAAAAPDGGLGQLPRRVLSGAGGAGRVRRRGTLAAEAETARCSFQQRPPRWPRD